jgi:hypothetical protein
MAEQLQLFQSDSFGARLCRAWAIAGCISCWVDHGRIESLEDRRIFVFVIVAAVLENAVVNSVLVRFSEIVWD